MKTINLFIKNSKKILKYYLKIKKRGVIFSKILNFFQFLYINRKKLSFGIKY